MARSYASTLAYLYGLQRHGLKLGLERIEALLEGLGHPERRYAALHIGGTNGKGSTAAMAAAMLRAAGYRVGRYTSPHLIEFPERIEIDGRPISPEEIVDLAARVQDVCDEALAPTFFEFTTAMAFQAFADAGVQIAVVEVGMGGRFDATNVLRPLAVAITTVSLDHQQYLGDTVSAIAFEKAGIIKADTAVVAGRVDAAAATVIREVASARGASVSWLGQDFRAVGDPLAGFTYEGMATSYRDLRGSLAGAHQLDNAACALALLERAVSRGLRLSTPAVVEGFHAVRWPGRLEILEQRPTLLVDGAHNPEAGAAVAAYLRTFRSAHPAARVILVAGMMRDKAHREFFEVLLPVIDDLVVTQVSMARAATVEELRASIPDGAPRLHVAPIPADALSLARQLASPDDLLCVTGSLMLVGEVKALLAGTAVSPVRG